MRAIATMLLALTAVADLGFGAELNKCRDGAGRVTYASESCESLGLKSAGPIRERTTVIPGAAGAARKSDSAKASAKTPGAGESELGGSPVQIKPINPLIEKLLK